MPTTHLGVTVRRITVLGAVLIAVAAVLTTSAALAKPQRIASLNLCTDQLVLMLVDPKRIVTVTFLARDPSTSYMAAAAATIPTNRGRLEQILPLQPDLVLAGRYTTHFTKTLLRKLGYPIFEADIPNTFDQVRAQVREVAALLGESEKGEALVAGMDAKLARAAAKASDQPIAALYGPRGYSQGAGTLENSVLAAAGYRNLAAEMGVSGSRVLSLEILLERAPRYLIFNARVDDAPSLAMAVLKHPALTRAFTGTAAIQIPPRFWYCPGPMLGDAVQFLAEARK